ncbi:MAG: hypothetical protein ACREA9_22425 [Pyrinomonadaceae bacterium]
MTKIATRFAPSALFGVFYLLTTPVRHPYFNSAIFVVALMTGILTLNWLLGGRKLSPTLMLISVLASYLASVIALIITWVVEGNQGISRFLLTHGTQEMLLGIAGPPVFSYAFIMFPLALVITYFAIKQRRGVQPPA